MENKKGKRNRNADMSDLELLNDRKLCYLNQDLDV